MALFDASQREVLPPDTAVDSDTGEELKSGFPLKNVLSGEGHAALLPWGGYKGAALGLAIEMLAG